MWKRYTLVSAAVLIAVVWAVWQFAFHGIHPKLIFSPPPPEPRAPAALLEIASIDVVETPLDDVLALLGQQHDVTIRIDQAATKAVTFTNIGSETITERIAGVTLQSLLNLLVAPIDSDLIVVWQDDDVVVTTWNAWKGTAANFISKVHHLTPLMQAIGHLDEDEITESITSLIDPLSWIDVGGLGSIETLPGAILVFQTPDAHERIEHLIKQMAEVANPVRTSVALSIPPYIARARERIQIALRSPTDLECIEMPLRNLCQWISDQHGIAVSVDWRALDADGLGDFPVTCNFDGISLNDALHQILAEVELVYVIHNEALLITTPEEANYSYSRLCLYPVRDIIASHPSIDSRSLIDAFTETVAPEWWKVGRAGDIHYWESGGAVVVFQTDAIHHELEKSLTSFRDALRSRFDSKVHPPLSAKAQQLEQTLAKRVTLNYRDEPLAQSLHTLSEEHGIEIRIDPKVCSPYPNPRVQITHPEVPSSPAPDPFGKPMVVDPFAEPPANDPDDCGQRLDAQVETQSSRLAITCDAENVSLETAIHWMLEPLELRCDIHNDHLWITWTSTNPKTTVRSYRVTGLVENAFGEYDPWPLAEIIMDVIESDSWIDVGGAGVVSPVGDVFVIRQSRINHRQIEQLLDHLLRVRHARA
ncbi:MAG: hypothetical protein IH991_24910, partial [Planctomycetes bacterium]|nr:hypothetical protein [Planctomycetota bacterium]